MCNYDSLHDDSAMELLLPLSPERRKEIDAVLQKSKEALKRNGLKGMMTLDEFEKEWQERLKEHGLI